MAGMAASIAGDRVEAFVTRGVAHVVLERPGAIERGGTEILAVPGDHVAGRIANAAADTFDRCVRGLPLLARRRHHGEIRRRLPARLERAARVAPFVEEL